MSGEEEAQEEVPETPSLRNSLVSSGEGSCVDAYGIGCLELETPSLSIAIIAVAVVDGRVLVALPEEAWARKRESRRLPAGAIRKATSLKVVSCALGDRGTPSEAPDLKIWVGILEPEYEQLVTFDIELPEIDFPGEAEQQRVPYAPALVAVCQDHFTFMTAESQVVPPPGLNPLEVRMNRMEQMLAEIRQVMRPPGVVANPKPAPSRPSALRRPSRSTPGPATAAQAFPANLDAAVVQQALQSGVSPEVLREMSGIVGPQVVPDRVTIDPSAAADGNNYPEEETEDDFVGVGTAEASDPMQTAVLQLTKLVSQLGDEKVRQTDRSLETLLDSAEGHGHAKEAGGYARSRAAALRELQRSLKKSLQLIYKALEQRLAEDWEEMGNQPGLTSSTVSARGWLEHRSRIQSFPASIRSGWALAGIWDCLRTGRHEEARARAGLALAQLDQQACDRGSFLLAAEVSLESAPPYSAFSSHQPPESWEHPHSKLLDPRWVDLMMSRLRDIADFQEKKAKLSGHRKQEENTENPNKLPKPGKPGKGNGKGKDGKGERGERDPPAAQ